MASGELDLIRHVCSSRDHLTLKTFAWFLKLEFLIANTEIMSEPRINIQE